MDVSVDPCEDFYRHACGGFIEREKIPAGALSTSYISLITNRNMRALVSIMDPNMTTPRAPNTGANAGEPAALENLQKIRDLYASCMNETQLTNLGRDPLLEQIEKLLQIFPVPDSALVATSMNSHSSLEVAGSDQTPSSQPSRNKTALAHALAYFNTLGLPSMNSISVTPDLRDPSRRVLLLSEGGVFLPKHLYRDPWTVASYEYMVGNMFRLIMGNYPHDSSSTPDENTHATTIAVPANWKDIAENVVSFELELLNASTPASFWEDPAHFHTPLSVEELSTLIPSIDWPILLNNTLPPGISNTRPISVHSTHYQERLEALLQRTSPQTLQNHFVWQLIWRLSLNLAPQYHQPILNFSRTLYDIRADRGRKRWDICTSVVSDNLGHMLGYYFVRKHYGNKTKVLVNDMIKSLRSEFRTDLSALQWLDDATRRVALEKIDAMTALVGFSTESPNVESALSLKEHYKDYQVRPGEFFQNRVRYKSWHTRTAFQKLNDTVNRRSLHLTPQAMSVFYHLAMNQILLPAGIFQTPLFHQDYPEYIHYGGIGVIIGHEMMHGMDEPGRYFDKTGRMISWWTNATEQAYEAKSQCFVDQYSQYTVQGPDDQMYDISGVGTKSENIADNGGLRLAYKTWKSRYNADVARVRNFKLFGLEDYTAEKLFFLSYAHFWCQKQHPMQLYMQLRSGTHSPNQWRTNGVLQNSPAFARAFNCSLGSPMNLEKKCKLW
ncbi:Endothelin-converting enzyme 2 [Mortierella alpina]|nr:Endothelin-converting enzyme 2 [Mortierella alpina]